MPTEQGKAALNFVCAYSKAWSPAEVEDALEQIVSYVPQDAQNGLIELQRNSITRNARGSLESASSAVVAEGMTNTTRFRQADAMTLRPELNASIAVGNLPPTAPAEVWFSQVNALNNLKQLAVTSSTDALDTQALSKDMTTDFKAKTLADDFADKRSDANNQAEAIGKEQTLERTNATAGNNIASGVKQNAIVGANAYRNGSLVLFVTVDEADQILNSIEVNAAQTPNFSGTYAQSPAGAQSSDSLAPQTGSIDAMNRLEERASEGSRAAGGQAQAGLPGLNNAQAYPFERGKMDQARTMDMPSQGYGAGMPQSRAMQNSAQQNAQRGMDLSQKRYWRVEQQRSLGNNMSNGMNSGMGNA